LRGSLDQSDSQDYHNRKESNKRSDRLNPFNWLTLSPHLVREPHRVDTSRQYGSLTNNACSLVYLTGLQVGGAQTKDAEGDPPDERIIK
jgi:hypothetical protein